MLNLKKVILGLGLLGVVSYANAAYVECPQSGYLSDGKFYHKDWKVKYDVEFMTADGRIFSSWGKYYVTSQNCMGGDNDGCTPYTTTVPEGYKEIPYGTTIYTLCSVKFTAAYWTTPASCSGTTINCVLRSGDIDTNTSSTQAVTNLTNENNILKAKVQALETKVYQCVQ